jgi:hypothetical protein
MLQLKSVPDRCDADGRAYAGSQRQIQYYVNEQPAQLKQAIAGAFHRPLPLSWVSPLRTEHYEEYRDTRFLQALGLGQYAAELTSFWPSGGPRWDALARVEGSRPGVLLLEAKSYVDEMRGGGCKAKDPASLAKIDAALVCTKTWLHVPQETNWKGDWYQMANRCAHLHFFREVLGVEAWLVNLCFLNDPHSPTSQAEWDSGLAAIKRELGAAKWPFCAEVFLPASN